MSGYAGEPASSGPTAVAVHDDSDVPGRVFPFLQGSQYGILGLAGGGPKGSGATFSGGVQQGSNLEELGLFVR
jgi:hypothetical protein